MPDTFFTHNTDLQSFTVSVNYLLNWSASIRYLIANAVERGCVTKDQHEAISDIPDGFTGFRLSA